jgi:hypothetical protein
MTTRSYILTNTIFALVVWNHAKMLVTDFLVSLSLAFCSVVCATMVYSVSSNANMLASWAGALLLLLACHGQAGLAKAGYGWLWPTKHGHGRLLLSCG